LAQKSGDPFGLYQSPEWFEYTRADQDVHAGTRAVAVCRNPEQALVGIVPIYQSIDRCLFPLALGRVHASAATIMLTLASGHLLVPPGEDRLDGLFSALAQLQPDPVPLKIENVPVPGPLHDYIRSSLLIRGRYFPYAVPGFERVHTIPLPSSYEQFLALYSAKKRYNLRRQFRLLEKQAEGQLQMTRCDSPDAIPKLLGCYDVLSEFRKGDVEPEEPLFTVRSPGGIASLYRNMARDGLLRAYLLFDKDRPIAALIGAQLGSTFILRRTLHDSAYNAVSPGVALLHLAIEDLIRQNSASVIILGYGSPEHDYRSTNVLLQYASYWLIPKTLKSRLFHAGYTLLRQGVASLKTAMPTPPPPAARAPEDGTNRR
jgi:hypothetical protein